MQKTIIVYSSHIDEYGGVTTFLYNWCLNLRNYYDITILYGNANLIQKKRLSKLVKLEHWESNKQYECDIVLRNSVWGAVPDNITSKDNRYLEMRHANYKYLLDKGLLDKQYNKWDKTNETIGCGYFVSEMSKLVIGDEPTTIQNILAPKQKTNKVLRLISCTRIDEGKGWNRMIQLMDIMRNNNIKFTWDIFTNDIKQCDYDEVKFHKARFDIFDYIASSDYTVLLSDCEGLPYTVQESLQYNVPCIVTDVEGCTELIKDGVNGYVVPLDMKFDINKILEIPKCEDYENHALEKWLEYLGNAEYIEKEIIEMRAKVIATKIFEKYTDSERGNCKVQEGDEWETSYERALMLKEKGAIKILEVIKKVETVEKTKRTRKKKEE